MSLMSGGFLVVALIVALFLFWYCINNTFQGKLFYYRIFKLGSLSKKVSVDPDGWTKGEKTLCGDFKKFIPAMDRAEFENSKEYLKKAGDLGRTPIPFWLILVIGLLIIAEGMGFSFLLGTFIAPEGTADTYALLMVAIVLTLCIVLGFIMHFAGHQLHRTRLIANCRRDWLETNSSDNKPFKTDEIGVHQNQGIDDADPPYTQIANRVGDRGSYAMVIIAALTISAIAFGSTYMRMKGLDKARADETLGKAAVSQSAPIGNPFASKSADGLPAEVVASNDSATAKGASQSQDAGTIEAYSAFGILGVIFVITQIVAITAGFKWGFAGKEGKSAYERTRGFASWTQVKEVKDAFIEPVEELTSALHSKFQGGNRKLTVHTFKQYIAKSSMDEEASTVQKDVSKPAANTTVAVPPLRESDIVGGPEAQPAPPQQAPSMPSDGSVQLHLNALDALSSKEDKQAYVARQSAGVREQIVDAVKARKQAEAAALKELEGLF